MEHLEAKLGTRLEWLAVDHFDTDNPHAHVLIRGRRADGENLFIPSRLISSGIREKAQEVVTRVLGPRLGVDLAQERTRDIAAMGGYAARPRAHRQPDAGRAGVGRPRRSHRPLQLYRHTRVAGLPVLAASKRQSNRGLSGPPA